LLAWCVALSVGAWVFADLFWRLAAPPTSISLPVAERDPAMAARRIADRHLFGASSSNPGADDGGRIVLFGAVTGDERHPGFAILSIDGGPAKDVVAGQELAPGLVLSQIRADRIELSGASGPRTVMLQPMRAGAEGMNGPPRVAPPSSEPMPATAPDTTRSAE
jgi:hypothetical protein